MNNLQQPVLAFKTEEVNTVEEIDLEMMKQKLALQTNPNTASSIKQDKIHNVDDDSDNIKIVNIGGLGNL